MEVSNKALGLLLIAAIVVSLSGTFISLDKLGGVSPTGYATNNQTGTVDLNVDASLSVTLTDNTIDFGSCSVSSTSVVNFDSELAGGAANNSLCDGTFPDELEIQNDGNVDANISIRTNTNGSTLFNDPNSGLAYKIENASTRGGCEGSYQSTYLNFTVTGAGNDYLGCSNLTFGDSADQIRMFASAWLDSTATGGGTATITFEAHPTA